MPTARRVLELIEPASPLTLGADAAATLRFRVTTLEGEPVEGARVLCSAAGVEGGATLGEPTETDAEGEARLELLTGPEPGFLRLRCSTSAGVAEVIAHVAISPTGSFGALLVEPAYEGQRAFQEVLVEAHFGRTCEPPPRARAELTLEVAAGEPARVEPVPAELAPALVVSLVDTRGRTVARGCLEGASASAGEATPVAVPVDDLPLAIGGDYDATLSVRSSSAAALAAAAGQSAAAAMTGADDARFMLEALRSELARRDFVIDLQTLDFDLEDLIATQLAEDYVLDGTAPSIAVASLAAQTSASSGALTLEGTLTISEAEPNAGYALTFEPAAIIAGAVLGAGAPLPLASFHGEASGAGTAGPLAEGALTAELSFGFGGGAIAAAGLVAQLDVDALRGAFGCETFATLQGFEGGFVECEEGCRLEVCEAAFSEVLGAFVDGAASAAAGSSLLVEMELRFQEAGGGVAPSAVDVESAFAQLMTGATIVELLDVSLDLAL